MTTSTPEGWEPSPSSTSQDDGLAARSPDAHSAREALAVDVPVVLRQAGNEWPVFSALQDTALAAYGDRVIEAEDRNGSARTVTLAELLADTRAAEPVGLYMRHQRVSEFDARLWQMVPHSIRRQNWLLALPPDIRPDWAWLLVGAADTSTALHVDTMASAAWNLLCSGRKSWSFHPPSRAVELGLLPPGCVDASDPTPSQRIDFVQEPGDLVVTPSGWAHEVRNLSATISVTANYINGSNLAFAKRYFRVLGDTETVAILDDVASAVARLET